MQDLIDRLKAKGIKFEKGMSQAEIKRAEDAYGIKFPAEIKEFLSYGVPVNCGFYNWRDCSECGTNKIKSFQEDIEKAFEFDFDNNRLSSCFKNVFPNIENEEELRKKIMDYLHSSPRLIPFYYHRCFFDGIDNMPIISFVQPIDSIFYGSDFKNYIENEFLRPEEYNVGEISYEFEKTGIWKELI